MNNSPSIPQRNMEAIAQKLREMDSRLCSQDEVIRSLQNQVAELTASNHNLLNQMNLIRAMTASRGPSAGA